MHATRPLLLAAVAIAGLVLAACGGDDDAPTTAAAASEGGTVEIVAEAMRFDPEQVTAPVGEVEFVLDNRDDGVPHNIAVTGNGIDEGTELEKGPVTQRLTVDFTEAGEYTYVCEIHPLMQGTIEIG